MKYALLSLTVFLVACSSSTPPTVSFIKQEIEAANYCEVDEDCAVFMGVCPFGCYVLSHVSEVDRIQAMVESYETNCAYGCMQMQPISCQENVCVMHQMPPGADDVVLDNDTLYDDQSWKTLISDTCQRFTDGCNTCFREGDMIGCTEMYCETFSKPACLDEGGSEEEAYDYSSWETLIDPECQSFTDGCNSCFRSYPGGPVACTQMYCETYAAPACLDGEDREDVALYDYNSWRTMIPDSCEHFSDGCNMCSRMPGASGVACTKKACAVYQMPRCLDEQ